MFFCLCYYIHKLVCFALYFRLPFWRTSTAILLCTCFCFGTTLRPASFAPPIVRISVPVSISTTFCTFFSSELVCSSVPSFSVSTLLRKFPLSLFLVDRISTHFVFLRFSRVLYLFLSLFVVSVPLLCLSLASHSNSRVCILTVHHSGQTILAFLFSTSCIVLVPLSIPFLPLFFRWNPCFFFGSEFSSGLIFSVSPGKNFRDFMSTNDVGLPLSTMKVMYSLPTFIITFCRAVPWFTASFPYSSGSASVRESDSSHSSPS